MAAPTAVELSGPAPPDVAPSVHALADPERTTVDAAPALLAVVAEPVRWTVLHRLAAGEACVCELQAVTAVATNLLSYHLKVLREAGLVTTTRRGRWVDYRLADDATARMSAALPGSTGGPP